MVRCRLGYLTLSDEQERVLVGICKDSISTALFVRLLTEVKQSVASEQAKSSQAYLYNNDPATRALALQQKGQMLMIDELISAIKNVTK